MSKTHGLRDSKEYKVWCNIKERCYNPNHPRFKDYGGRGIIMSGEWKDSFENFFADMGFCPEDKDSLDRINNNGNYEQCNCKWADDFEQANNKSNNRILEYNEKSMTLAQWSIYLKIDSETIMARINNGWDMERVINTPVRDMEKLIEFNGKIQNIKQWSKEIGVSESALGRRFLDGWTIERALTEPARKTEVLLDFDKKILNITEWSKITGIPIPTIYKRIKSGWSTEKALTTLSKKNKNTKMSTSS